MTAGGADLNSFAGRCLYASLLSEAIPRALLDRFHLSHQLLGSSGGGQFLVVLTTEVLPGVNEFLVNVTRALADISDGALRLAWSATENLGDWSDVRKRLVEGFEHWKGLNALDAEAVFRPYRTPDTEGDAFAALFDGLPASLAVRWDDSAPLMLASSTEELPLAHHRAPGENGAATLEELAARASGHRCWGVLRADVDQFAARLRRAQTIEEHLQFSVFFRQFFAGEVQVLCSQAEYWQKVTVLFTGGDEFAIVGAWDALIPFAREIERLFTLSVDEFLKEFHGPEGKSMSMAIAIAPDADTPLCDVYAEAGRLLESAKNTGKNSIHVFGRTLEWGQLAAAAELKNTMTRLIADFGCSPQFLDELRMFYRETDRVLPSRASRQRAVRQERPWRFHRRVVRLLEGSSRQRDFQKARAALMAEFIQRNQSYVKLKPSGRVALEWARLAQES